jgi:hypothetical protein
VYVHVCILSVMWCVHFVQTLSYDNL